MPTKQHTRTKAKGRRKGWGKAILIDLPLPEDERLEKVRGVVDRTTFARVAVLEKIRRESAA